MGKRGLVEAGESGKEGRGGILNTLNPTDEEERNKGFSLSLKVKVAQSYPTSQPRILQARILEWVAISFSRRFSQPRDRTQVSRIAGGFFTS